MFYIFAENGKLNGAGECPQLTEGVLNIQVTEEIYNAYIEAPNKFAFQDGQIVLNPNYEDELAQEREELFKKDFIQTAWGWYRKHPQGYANAPQSIDIILNMVNALGGFTEQVANLMIFYTEPDFTDAEQCTDEWLIANQFKKEPCTTAEFMQFYIDFQTRWVTEQHQN